MVNYSPPMSSLLDMQTGGRLLPSCKAATMTPRMATATNSALNSGDLGVSSIMLPAGMIISNMLACTSSSGESGGTHGWYVLLDSNRVVRAVTADQTGAAVWGAFTSVPVAFTAPYTVPSSGRYLVGICVVATGMPTFAGTDSVLISLPNGADTFSLAWSGISSTGQTTPPALGATMGAVSVGGTTACPYVELS